MHCLEWRTILVCPCIEVCNLCSWGCTCGRPGPVLIDVWPIAPAVYAEPGDMLCRIYWMNPLQYAQKAILVNEFTAGRYASAMP